MHLELIVLAAASVLLVGMLVFSELGRRLAAARLARDPKGVKGTGSAAAAVFGLLGLLLAFTFSGAAGRFEARRHLITEEANDIGTAYLRIDLVPGPAQPELRALFRRYVDVRAVTYRQSSLADSQARLAEAADLQARIWAAALAGCRRPEAATPCTMLLLPALNAMFDITTTRAMATENHPPLVIFLMLAALSLVGALLVGHDMAANRERPWLHPIVFATIISLSVYVILDLEFPHLGLIRVDSADHVISDLRSTMD
ncbi:bestrophin-like domain [Agrilutibacter solisilvae]|uniref:DUF4239 domain-containing protein n=1 Tax=Agrilutibacter solisilvae TaxID=2763317 RepID=A0A974XZH4_9GAMM|nr:hypothetical protein [Lysobacter solisilvae]QSX77763.1 hypothetical protein I8J32_013640 [Lysobacter solisilvae]